MRTILLAFTALLALGLSSFCPSMANLGSAEGYPPPSATVQRTLALFAQAHEENQDAIDKFMWRFNEPILVRESKPVTVNDARFVAVAQTNWVPAAPQLVFAAVSSVEIQLRIANESKRTIAFPTFRNLGIRLRSADGKEIKRTVLREGATPTSPILVPAGVSYTLSPRAELRWDAKTKAAELAYFDETGSKSLVGPLDPGLYTLAFWYSVPPCNRGENNAAEIPTWSGEAVTGEVGILIAQQTTRGAGAAGEQALAPCSQPLRIQQSLPAASKDAQLVLVAQPEWKPGKPGEIVPIDMQLRLSNLGNKDLVFPTFDTFGMRIVDGHGKKLVARGGRNSPVFTRPVCLPAGSSFSFNPKGGTGHVLRHRAELHVDAKTKEPELVYYYGTGMIEYFGPLRPGPYKLSFHYAVSDNPPLNPFFRPEIKMGHLVTWTGSMTTPELPIEILHP